MRYRFLLSRASLFLHIFAEDISSAVEFQCIKEKLPKENYMFEMFS